MPRDTTLDCLLASFENMLVAREDGDEEAKAAAAAEFKKWLKEAVTACSPGHTELVKELAVALERAKKYIPTQNPNTLEEADDWHAVNAVLAKAKAAGLV